MRTARPPKDIPPPLELECLKALWDLGEGNVRAVQTLIEHRRKLAYTTVMTLLERLAKKGAVSRRKAGRSFIYTPVVDRETLRRKAVIELADSLFEGSPQLLASYLQNGDHRAAPVQPDEPTLDTTLL